LSDERQQRLDGHAEAYSKAFPHFEENRIVHEAYGQQIALQIGALGLRSVLSLGIGHTEVARPIVQALQDARLDRYVIVDASPAIVSTFRQSMAPLPSGLQVVEAFFESFEDGQGFDAIEAGFVLEHVDDPALVLRRMRRLIRPGGRMFVAVPNACSLHRRIGHAAGLLPDMFRLSDADHALGHQRYFDLPSLRQLVADCGWQVQAQAGLLLKPFTTGQLAKLELSAAVWQALQAVAAPYPELSNAVSVELAPA
jgi:SAM-dependent methyltransferase